MALVTREKYYSPAEVAVQLDVCQRTVYNWLRGGELEGIKRGKLWRIPSSAIYATSTQEDTNGSYKTDSEGQNILLLPT